MDRRRKRLRRRRRIEAEKKEDVEVKKEVESRSGSVRPKRNEVVDMTGDKPNYGEFARPRVPDRRTREESNYQRRDPVPEKRYQESRQRIEGYRKEYQESRRDKYHLDRYDNSRKESGRSEKSPPRYRRRDDRDRNY